MSKLLTGSNVKSLSSFTWNVLGLSTVFRVLFPFLLAYLRANRM